jgi:hypothetical protein
MYLDPVLFASGFFLQGFDRKQTHIFSQCIAQLIAAKF